MTAILVFVLFTMLVSAHGHHEHNGHHESNEHSSTIEPDCPVCTLDGCTEYGRHAHNGHDYCGNDHKDDYCDGSCEISYCKNGIDRGFRSRNTRHHGLF